jgi:hypothetical protein
MRCGGASPKIVICEARQRRITKKKSVHRTYTCRVWNTLKERKKERKIVYFPNNSGTFLMLMVFRAIQQRNK